MKKYILLITLLFALTACSLSTKSITPSIVKKRPSSQSKTLVIDLDEEVQLKEAIGGFKDNSDLLVDEPIYIGDNDEVSFKGDIIKKKSPVTIKVSNQKSIKFNGKNYTIKKLKLKDGDNIQIKDKNGKVFVDVTIKF